MTFENDAFISYAHVDNAELVEGRKGWITNLHRALEVRVTQLMSRPPRIWRDLKLNGNDNFADAMLDQLRHVASLIPVVTPRYVKSEWTRKELAEFTNTAAKQAAVAGGQRARIFKVVKTPVPVEAQPPELQALLGYEFYKVDPNTGKVQEFNEVFGPEAVRDFWIRLDDLAHELCCILEMMEGAGPSPADDSVRSECIFLAETTSDVREQREAIRRDLQQHGYTVLPNRTLPLVKPELEAAIRDDLARCRMSVHLIGKTASLVPEGGSQSLLEIQNELAIERGHQDGFTRLLWIPPGLQVTDERQRKLIEQLRMDDRTQNGADLLETSLEDLRTVIQDRLRKAPRRADEAGRMASAKVPLTQLYLIYDQRDADAAAPWANYLFETNFEVIHPVFEGDEAEIREYHEENLRTCDAALILFGRGNECWLRRKLRELQKSAGYGGARSREIGISIIPPASPGKERFQTHGAVVMDQLNGFSPDSLRPFVSRFN
jgi:hypothetical protein